MMMKLSGRSAGLVLMAALALASCAGPEKPKPVSRAARAGASFNSVGSVAFYEGQPCTSQIMFLFRAGKSEPIAMAARARESKVLGDAARRHRRVRVSGRWRHGKQHGCAYVEVSSVDVQRGFW